MTRTDAWAVIMAGGSGTRFWPLSRRKTPKQLLPLVGGEGSLLSETVRRIAPAIPPERVVVVTSEQLREASMAQLPQVPPANFLAEPAARNTAPCVGWAAAFIGRRDPNAILAVLAADHFIANADGFLTILNRALDAARDGSLVTVGITPTRPETGYGYLELGDPVAEGVFQARRFVEKPNRARAEQFLAAHNYLWNSGMFFFRVDAVRSAIQTHLPGLGEALDRFDHAAAAGNEDAILRAEFPNLPSISIDHGVMEKAERVLVIPGDFGWSDVGSWMTAWELADKDVNQNAIIDAETVAVDAKGCYVKAPNGKFVALVGVEDLVVVDTEDALLVVPRERAQEVRAVVEALRSSDRDLY